MFHLLRQRTQHTSTLQVPAQLSHRATLLRAGAIKVRPSTRHLTSFSPIDAGYEERASLTSPDGKPGRPLFRCLQCPERKLLTQKQVLLRHQREKHQPRFECLHADCNYKWTRSRRSEYKKHLKRIHGLKYDKIDEIRALSPTPRVIESDPAPHFSPPFNDVHHASPPLIPSVVYNPRLGDGEPDITTEHGDYGLEHLAATHAPSAFLYEEGFTWPVRHYQIHGQFRFVQPFYIRHI